MIRYVCKECGAEIDVEYGTAGECFVSPCDDCTEAAVNSALEEKADEQAIEEEAKRWSWLLM